MKKEYLNEIWKPIKGYEGLYEVSNFGRIRSLDAYKKGRNGSVRFCKGRILKPFTDTSGYLQVGLFKNGKRKIHLVNRLVAQAFIDNPDNLPQVNHKDENKQNNVVSNLEWCTHEYNINYGTRIERCSKPVLQYTLDGEFIREWASATQAKIEGGFHQGHIAACCRGEQNKHKNCIWKYKE